MKRRFAILALPLLLAPWVQARESSAKMSPAIEARFATLPDRLAGLPRVDGSYDKPMAAYRGPSNLDPVIAIVFADIARPATWREMAAIGRASAAQAELIDTLFEGSFSLVGHAGATSYFGDYLTKQGVKQSWIVEHDGVRTTVLVTLYRTEDRRRIFDAIRRDLFGGIEMQRVAAADAN